MVGHVKKSCGDDGVRFIEASLGCYEGTYVDGSSPFLVEGTRKCSCPEEFFQSRLLLLQCKLEGGVARGAAAHITRLHLQSPAAYGGVCPANDVAAP